MRVIVCLLQVTLLFIFYLIGEWIQDKLNLIIPGSIIGMVLLFILLKIRWIPGRFVDSGADFLLRSMPLLFLPAIVGIINYRHLFLEREVFVFVVVFLSTLIVMASSAVTSQFLMKGKAEGK